MREIWESVRNPSTGIYSLRSLKVFVGKKTYSLYPPNWRVPKSGPSETSRKTNMSQSFDRLYREDRVDKFKIFVDQ